jgi:hypothetical protein
LLRVIMRGAVAPKTIVRLLGATILLAVGAGAQTGTAFLPQIDTYIGLTPAVSLFLLAAGSVDDDASNQNLVLGPNIDIALLPFLEPRLRH